jgi:ABC-2 type transport system ATP-binding protein
MTMSSEPASPPVSPSATRSAVRFDDVHMVFTNKLKRPVQALRGLSVDIEQGSIVGMLGPNGSGKTTAISCVLGLLRPQAGRILLWDEPLRDNLPSGHDKRIGVLLEDTRLPPFLSVQAAIETVCRLRGLAGPQVAAERDRVVAETHSEGLLTRRVAVLSKGQARRVGLAAALVGDPPLLILDEPSAGLDIDGREEFNALVRSLKGAASRRTVLIASHLLGDIESTCTHVAIVDRGRILLFRTAVELLAEARQRCSDKDIHVEATFAAELEQLGVRTQPSRYPGLVQLLVEEPEHELIGRLAARRIVPARIEPRVNLVSVYLEATRGRADS